MNIYNLRYFCWELLKTKAFPVMVIHGSLVAGWIRYSLCGEWVVNGTDAIIMSEVCSNSFYSFWSFFMSTLSRMNWVSAYISKRASGHVLSFHWALALESTRCHNYPNYPCALPKQSNIWWITSKESLCRRYTERNPPEMKLKWKQQSFFKRILHHVPSLNGRHYFSACWRANVTSI